MARNSKRKGKRSNKRGNFDFITRVPVQDFLNAAFSSGQWQTSLHPAELSLGTTSVGLLAEAFEFYKVTKLRYRIHPNGGGTDVAAAYIAGVVDNPPTTVSGMAAVGTHVLLSDDTVVPTAWRSVSKSDLASYQNWYKTALGTPDPAQEIQGIIYVTAGTGTDQVKVELDAVYEFKSLVPPGATPRERGNRECQAERDRIMRIIQMCPLVPADTSPSGARGFGVSSATRHDRAGQPSQKQQQAGSTPLMSVNVPRPG